MESFIENLETLIDQQEPKVRDGEDLAVFAIAYEGNEFAFRQFGNNAEVIILLSRVIRNSLYVEAILRNALIMAKKPMSGLDEIFKSGKVREDLFQTPNDEKNKQ